MSKDFNVYKWRRDNLTEDESAGAIVKSLKDVTQDDVDGLAVPTMSAGSMLRILTQRNFDEWKSSFPNQNVRVIIDRSNPTWFEQVKIDDKEYNDMIRKGKDAIQADYDKYRGRNQGD
jgi:hypothetical protein